MPNTPVAPSLLSIGSTTFVISVNADGNPAGTFYSFRVTFGTTTKFINGAGILQDDKVFLNVTSLSVSGLTPNTIHAVSLSAADNALGANETSFGPSAGATTLAADPVAQPYENVFSTTVKANWSANGNPAGTNYFVDLSTDPNFLFNTISVGPITTEGFVFTNLVPATTYHGRVKARNSSAVDTAFVSLGTVVTAVGPSPVRAIRVTNLLAERGFLVQWSPNLETNLAQYNVYRSSSPTDDSEFELIGTTPSNVTSFRDSVPFTFGIVWYYKVTALDVGNNESALELTTPAHDNSFHSFEEQPFPTVVQTTDLVEDETPDGVVDTSNTVFTTAFPYKKNTLEVYLNGVRQHRGLDFNETSSQQFTFLDPPDTGGFVRVSYIRF